MRSKSGCQHNGSLANLYAALSVLDKLEGHHTSCVAKRWPRHTRVPSPKGMYAP